MTSPPKWEEAFALQDELNQARAMATESRENAMALRRPSRTERWFQTFIQALILALCGFVVWAVACRGVQW